ncbi:hypothetical protein MZO42_05730 [Sphingomonas psychrotolerans]|uniref:DUF4430 domain-containing protein n=1 Tax=Sphingomonas psychrotolerans TaxID=1327635 RepID=A0ABU3N0X3_9SPHN|nr:hypothetical protein [Sphingomonas psychrotolerans]MDT8758190.1 hypothetical protein [Sphingomonas psychrotolerans]
MSESCTVVVTNNSGRSLDAVKVWYSLNNATPDDLAGLPPAVAAANLPDGASIKGTTQIGWLSPLNYWVGGVLFEGDGTTYILCGLDGETGKEFEVSDGSTITFIVNAYTAGTTNQKNNVSIEYSEGPGGEAQLLHEGVGELANVGMEVVKTVGELLDE